VTPSASPIICFNRTDVNLFNNIDYLAPVLEEFSALHIRAGQAVAFEFDVSAMQQQGGWWLAAPPLRMRHA
jgi:hypothetical protein